MSLRYGCESDFLVTTTLYAYIFHHEKASCKKIWSRPGQKTICTYLQCNLKFFASHCAYHIYRSSAVFVRVFACIYFQFLSRLFHVWFIRAKKNHHFQHPFAVFWCVYHMNFQFILICMQSASMTKFSFVPHLFN